MTEKDEELWRRGRGIVEVLQERDRAAGVPEMPFVITASSIDWTFVGPFMLAAIRLGTFDQFEINASFGDQMTPLRFFEEQNARRNLRGSLQHPINMCRLVRQYGGKMPEGFAPPPLPDFVHSTFAVYQPDRTLAGMTVLSAGVCDGGWRVYDDQGGQWTVDPIRGKVVRGLDGALAEI
jgi:hypothetical protein